MRSHFFKTAAAVFVLLGMDTAATADDYVIDAAHSGVSLQDLAPGLDYVHGTVQQFHRQFHDRHQRSRQVVVHSHHQAGERRYQQHRGGTHIFAAPTSSTSSSIPSSRFTSTR